MNTKPLYVIISDCGDGSYYPQYTLNSDLIIKLQQAYDKNLMSYEEKRRIFEVVHCGNNKRNTARNSTDDSYVLHSVQDAWAGWQTCHDYITALKNKNDDGFHYSTINVPEDCTIESLGIIVLPDNYADQFFKDE
jgi:hypothetical protein